VTHKQFAVRRRNVLTHRALSQAIFPPPSRARARPTIRPIVVFTKRTHFGIGLAPPLQVYESRHDLKELLSFASNPPRTRRVRRCHQQPRIGQLS